ncbi:MAG: DUF2569 domain-containing protein [Gammaproteobacteria bacterium]|nr:DUF2569 domain-containing protein [Gammaproteobacteria bacterium]MDH5650390.1 DUF2569 domain-containing protein [Gammaproteobacteria bacterium]
MDNNSNEDKDLKGLGGWLILVGIGVVLSPIRLLVTFVPLYIPIFQDGTWEMLTTEGAEAYNPLWAPMLMLEIGYNVIMVFVSIYLIYLFFTRHYLFPKVMIVVMAASIVFIPLDAWLITFIVPGEAVFDSETLREFSRVLIAGCIWIPYMLVSKRVKLTFVEGKNKLNEDVAQQSAM